MPDAIFFQPIGLIHSPFNVPEDTPIQPSRSQAAGQVEVYPEFSAGLQDIEGFSHIYLIYHFHRSAGCDLLVQPFLDDRKHGLFSTRYPRRPNQIGLSIVRLTARTDNILHIEGVDVLDGTPLLDIKPYFPDFDHQQNVRIGWYSQRSKE